MGKWVEQLFARAAQSTLGKQCITLLRHTEPQNPNLLQILTYHLIHNSRAFDQQMAYLAANYHVVSAVDVLEAVNGGKPLPSRALMITFDDAYRNFADCAWPIMKRYRLPVTVFVPTAFPDQPDRLLWWDQLQHALNFTPRRDVLNTPMGKLPLGTSKQRRQATRRLKAYGKALPHREVLAWTEQICETLAAPRPEHNNILSWDELRCLSREGVILGPHTHTHPLMNRVTPQEALDEAVRSYENLEREIGEAWPIFAYPSGQFSHEVVAHLRRAGFKLGFTTIRGTNDLNSADPLRLRRNNIGWQASLPILQARLLHGSFRLNRWRPLDGAPAADINLSASSESEKSSEKTFRKLVSPDHCPRKKIYEP